MSREDQFTRSIGLSRDGNPSSVHTKGAGKTKSHYITASYGNPPRPSGLQTITTGSNEPITTSMKELDAIVEQFRNKHTTKARAIALITSILAFDFSKEEPSKDAALSQYISMLNTIEHLINKASKCGTHTASGLGNLTGEQHDEGMTSTDPKEEVVILSAGGRDKRRRGVLESDNDDADGEDDRTDDESNKRQRIFEKDMPWYQRESAARLTADPSCTKTRETLGIFKRDYATVKSWISYSQSAPRGFPATEWDHIIKGKPVDLDTVLSSLYYVSPVKENVGCVGRTEIVLGRTEPIRRVQTSGQWTSAWNATVKAYLFAFPHREDELRAYGDCINREFSSRVVTAHRKIILYDAAVRNEVGGGQSTLLTNPKFFSYIYYAGTNMCQLDKIRCDESAVV